ncbi:MAG: inorganic phosphate transporter [Verrucomicrobiota bacterium]
MPDAYLLLVILLFALAAADLVVGVSNDAVNFLNSAIGSRVARRRIIMIVASLGIFIGAASSGGMMEVARKGIFVPGQFYFDEIMVIFIAVMLTDIILLDLFNTFGMPTSTTVSIVFELLGAAVAVALVKIAEAGSGAPGLEAFINSDNARTIIEGIFMSVPISFAFGLVIMWISRLIFTFTKDPGRMQFLIIWAAAALTMMSYFLLVKGLNNASIPGIDVIVTWLREQPLLIVFGSLLAFWFVVTQFISLALKANFLRFTVLFGTFSLAMAFAGNDLVNFIGVPIAGFQAFVLWKDSGADPSAFPMTALEEKVPSANFILLLAGAIMVITLWISKKSRTVTKTEVTLGRQRKGHERFTPGPVSKGIIWISISLFKTVSLVIPPGGKSWINTRFSQEDGKSGQISEEDRPAFDLIRATVNLAVASVVISIATLNKLPLSTTYVSFMVAMGASLADRAWGQESAPARVAGVVTVIGGWFMTAIIAFTVSGTFAFLVSKLGLWFVIVLALLAALFIHRTFALHAKRESPDK